MSLFIDGQLASRKREITLKSSSEIPNFETIYLCAYCVLLQQIKLDEKWAHYVLFDPRKKSSNIAMFLNLFKP